jgi:hypothetical protein
VLGRHLFVHGSHPAHDYARSTRRGPDLLDVAVLVLPVLLALVAFVAANML